MSNGKYVVRLTLILFAITAVVALLLAGVNAITAGPIAAYKEEKTASSIHKVLISTAAPEEVGSFRDETGLIKTCWKLGEDGYAYEVVVPGSQGDIDMMVGVGSDGKVSGISFISMSETSGLGAVAAQNNTKGLTFRGQFKGLSGEIAVKKDGGTVDALTGATVTSRAVTRAVNAALACSFE